MAALTYKGMEIFLKALFLGKWPGTGGDETFAAANTFQTDSRRWVNTSGDTTGKFGILLSATTYAQAMSTPETYEENLAGYARKVLTGSVDTAEMFTSDATISWTSGADWGTPPYYCLFDRKSSGGYGVMLAPRAAVPVPSGHTITISAGSITAWLTAALGGLGDAAKEVLMKVFFGDLNPYPLAGIGNSTLTLHPAATTIRTFATLVMRMFEVHLLDSSLNEIGSVGAWYDPTTFMNAAGAGGPQQVLFAWNATDRIIANSVDVQFPTVTAAAATVRYALVAWRQGYVYELGPPTSIGWTNVNYSADPDAALGVDGCHWAVLCDIGINGADRTLNIGDKLIIPTGSLRISFV